MGQPKRVLHVVGAMNIGGTETMLMNLYRNIDRNKVQFDFISFSNEEGYYDKEIINMGGRIINISQPNLLILKTEVSELVEVINKYGPYQVVHAHTLFNSGIAMIAAKKSNIKIRITHAHTTSDNETSLIRKIYVKYMRNVINKNSTYLFACSNEAGKYLFGDKSIHRSNYIFFSNLIDYEKIFNANKDKVIQFKYENNLDDNLVIGHVGTFKEAKNQKFLIEILHYLINENSNIKLLLVGDGSMRKELEDLVRDYDLQENVIFTGIREDVEVMLHCMDIFVFPSTYEGLGLVLLEAQAAGLSCLLSEAIQPEADINLGLIKQLRLSDGVETWGSSILKLSRNGEVDNKTIKNAFEGSNYSTQRCINKLMKIYEID